jgi:hypothetical protein
MTRRNKRRTARPKKPRRKQARKPPTPTTFAQMKEAHQRNKAFNRFRSQLNSGSGLLMDKELRHWLSEYNDRLIRHGTESLPSSYAGLRNFFRIDDQSGTLILRPENDHLFHFSDFLDFITSADVPQQPFAAALDFRSGEIYSFSRIDPIGDLVFSTQANDDFAFAGVSICRIENLVSVLLLGGRADDSDMDVPLIFGSDSSVPRTKRSIKPDASLSTKDSLLDSTTGRFRTLAIAEFDLENAALQRRYILRDIGASYVVHTDDPSVFHEDLTRKQLDEYAAPLESYATLFELCATSLLLRAYFAFRITLVRNEDPPSRSETPPPVTPASAAPKPKLASQPTSSTEIRYRKVAALRIINDARISPTRRYAPPQFRVRVRGFWRRLPPGHIGADPNGDPVVGRTWVSPHDRFRDKPIRPREVLVKSRIAIAQAIANADIESARESARASSVSSGQPTETTDLHHPTRAQKYQERRKLTARLRWSILQRDDFRCTICGADGANDQLVKLHVDHINPISKGGLTVQENLRTLCSTCNIGKSDSPMPSKDQ